MGTAVRLKNQQFKMTAEAARKARRRLLEEVWVGGDTPKADDDATYSEEDLVWGMDEWGWEFEYDDGGNVTALRMGRDKWSDQDEFLRLLGPFADARSFVEVELEDGSRYRWSFDGQRVRRRKVASKPSPPAQPRICVRLPPGPDAFDMRLQSIDRRYADSVGVGTTLAAVGALLGFPKPLGHEIRNGWWVSCSYEEVAALFDPKDANYDMVVLSESPVAEMRIGWKPESRYFDCGVMASWERLSLGISLNPPFEWPQVLDWARKIVAATSSHWAEVISRDFTDRRTFLMPGSRHLALPHLAPANYFGPEYVEFFGGRKVFEKAGYVLVEPLGEGLFVVMPDVQTPEEFLTMQREIETRLGNPQAFDPKSENRLPRLRGWRD